MSSVVVWRSTTFTKVPYTVLRLMSVSPSGVPYIYQSSVLVLRSRKESEIRAIMTRRNDCVIRYMQEERFSSYEVAFLHTLRSWSLNCSELSRKYGDNTWPLAVRWWLSTRRHCCVRSRRVWYLCASNVLEPMLASGADGIWNVSFVGNSLPTSEVMSRAIFCFVSTCILPVPTKTTEIFFLKRISWE